MEVVIVLVVLGVILWLAIAYWYITLPVVAIGVWLYFQNEKQKADAALKAAEAARRATRKAEEAAQRAAREAERLRHRQEQEAYGTKMLQLGEQSLGIFESMPKQLQAAELQLDQAEIDFAEGVFAPFWDSVERAANSLGRFDEGIRSIGTNSTQYTGLIKQYELEPPGFPLSAQTVAKLSAGSGTAERMKAIVRNAQRSFQFATIYEQRKTNQLLVAGFTSLGQALEQMTWRITSSIGDLAGSIDSMGSMLSDSMRAVDSRLVEMESATVQHREALAVQNSERAGREEKAIEMLDNIQRRRKP